MIASASWMNTADGSLYGIGMNASRILSNGPISTSTHSPGPGAISFVSVRVPFAFMPPGNEENIPASMRMRHIARSARV